MIRPIFSGFKSSQSKINANNNNVNSIGSTNFTDIYNKTNEYVPAKNNMSNNLNGMHSMKPSFETSVWSSLSTEMDSTDNNLGPNEFGLKIEDDAMFIVSDENGYYYTKSGSFHIDESGALVGPHNLKVQGWPANSAGTEIMPGIVRDLLIYTPENIISQPKTTTDVYLEGNLNSGDSVNNKTIFSSIKFFDTLGNQYKMPIAFTPSSDQNTWTVSVPTEMIGSESFAELMNPEGNLLLINPPVIQPDSALIKFDNNGNLNGLEKLQITAIDLHSAVIRDPDNSSIISSANISSSVGLPGGIIDVDLSSLTQNDSPTDLFSRLGTKNFENSGQAPGSLRAVDIEANGIIKGYYSNGDEKLLGQVPVMYFDNPTDLEKVVDNVFQSTANSGNFDGIGTTGSFIKF